MRPAGFLCPPSDGEAAARRLRISRKAWPTGKLCRQRSRRTQYAVLCNQSRRGLAVGDFAHRGDRRSGSRMLLVGRRTSVCGQNFAFHDPGDSSRPANNRVAAMLRRARGATIGHAITRSFARATMLLREQRLCSGAAPRAASRLNRRPSSLRWPSRQRRFQRPPGPRSRTISMIDSLSRTHPCGSCSAPGGTDSDAATACVDELFFQFIFSKQRVFPMRGFLIAISLHGPGGRGAGAREHLERGDRHRGGGSAPLLCDGCSTQGLLHGCR